MGFQFIYRQGNPELVHLIKTKQKENFKKYVYENISVPLYVDGNIKTLLTGGSNQPKTRQGKG